MDLALGSGSGLADRSSSDSTLGLFSWSSPCWVCFSTLPLKLNLRFFLHYRFLAPAPPVSLSPSTCTSTCPVPHSLTLSVNISVPKALFGSIGLHSTRLSQATSPNRLSPVRFRSYLNCLSPICLCSLGSWPHPTMFWSWPFSSVDSILIDTAAFTTCSGFSDCFDFFSRLGIIFWSPLPFVGWLFLRLVNSLP